MPLSITTAAPNDDEDRVVDNDAKNELAPNVEDVPQTVHSNAHPQPGTSRRRCMGIPSNECILGTAFTSFTTFALTQLVFAFIAGSAAMKGDSAAMIVDAVTYLFNWMAERRKNCFDELYDASKLLQQQDVEQNNGEDPVVLRSAAYIRNRDKRKLTVQLEIVPPLFSILSLVSVTVYIIHKSVTTLILDANRPVSEQAVPNLKIMLTFSSMNLALDILNVTCFARAKHLLGYATVERVHDHSSCPKEVTPCTTSHGSNTSHNDGDTAVVCCTDLCLYKNPPPDGSSSHCHSHYDKDHANLNMCSAYTHVMADTLRSLAVIVAVILALIIAPVTPEVADATAAVVVSSIILISLLPLLQGLVARVRELRGILAEERNEQSSSTTTTTTK
jgi:Co/Zn/Cd efflux system component